MVASAAISDPWHRGRCGLAAPLGCAHSSSENSARTKPMVASPRSAWAAVYKIVCGIPRGKIMTYGQISMLLGRRISAQYVGFAMHSCPKDVPWHRVVNASGGCSTDRLPGDSVGYQRILLELEGVQFGANGKLPVERYRWSPKKSSSSQERNNRRSLNSGN